MRTSRLARHGAALIAIGFCFASPGLALAEDAASPPAATAATPAETSAPAFTVKDLKIGSPVFGADGMKVGEVNRIKADSNGTVTEVQVTTGGPIGLDAEVVSIKAEQIATNEANSLKLKISGTDAKSLPVLGADSKG